MSEQSIVVIRKKVGQAAELVEISRSFEYLQEAVGGCVELVPLFEGITMLCNEDAKLLGQKLNMAIPWKDDFVAGDVLFVRIDGRNNWTSVCRDDLSKVCDYFGIEQMGFPV